MTLHLDGYNISPAVLHNCFTQRLGLTRPPRPPAARNPPSCPLTSTTTPTPAPHQATRPRPQRESTPANPIYGVSSEKCQMQ